MYPACSVLRSWAAARWGGGRQACRHWLMQPSPASPSSEVRGQGQRPARRRGAELVWNKCLWTEGDRLGLAGLRGFLPGSREGALPQAEVTPGIRLAGDGGFLVAGSCGNLPVIDEFGCFFISFSLSLSSPSSTPISSSHSASSSGIPRVHLPSWSPHLASSQDSPSLPLHVPVPPILRPLSLCL